MERTKQEVQVSDFDRAREMMAGTPGFIARRSTVTANPMAWIPQADWIVETFKNSEGFAIFLRRIGADGGQRFVLPDKAVQSIYRQYDSIMKQARKNRAKTAVETRKSKKTTPVEQTP